MKTITLSLSEQSINAAISELERYRQWAAEKQRLLCERLAIIGAHEASVRFASAMYDGNNDVTVDVAPTANGYVITARGQAVAFIEFGAGVYFNKPEPYPNRPPEVAGIGEYGKGFGERKAWGYYDGGDLVITHGNPAAMPMWYASKEIEMEVRRIAQEVFAG